MQAVPILWTLAVKGTAILATGWLAAWCLRGRSAAARHLVWTATFAALLALPALTMVLPALSIATPSLPGTRFLFEMTAIGHTGAAAQMATANSASATASAQPPAGSPLGWGGGLLAVWIAGMAVLLLQTAAAHIALWHLRRRAKRLDASSAVPVYEAPAGSMPMTTGLWRPIVFMPADANLWTEERRRIVLQHELAHVERGDLATQFFARVAIMIHWWNPLVWLTWREFVKDRERAADDLVLISGTRPSDYASHLLEVARAMHSSTPLAWAAVAMARPSQLEGRLLAILDARRQRGASTPKAAAAAALAAVMLIAPFAAIRAQNSPDTANPPEIDAVLRAAAAQKNHEMLEQAASAYERVQRFEMAQKLLESALTIRGEVSGSQSRQYAAGLVKLADLAIKRGKYSDADALYARAIALGDAPDVVPALIALGMRAYGQNDDDRAAALFQRALTADPRGPKAGSASTWLANTRARDTRTAAEAESLYLQAMSLEDPTSLEYAMTLDFYSFFLKKQSRDSEAQETQLRARDIRRAAVAAGQATAGFSNAVRMNPSLSSPALLSKVEPEYSPEARAAKFQGTVLLSVEVDTDGLAKNIQVARSLGLGLDEKAVEAVRKWTFRPALDAQGNPVVVAATIEINFKLL